MMYFELEKAGEKLGAYTHVHGTVNFGEGIETRIKKHKHAFEEHS